MADVNGYKELIVWQKEYSSRSCFVSFDRLISRRGEIWDHYLKCVARRFLSLRTLQKAMHAGPRQTSSVFISNAEGSLAELDTQLIIAIELDFCTKEVASDCFSLIEEIRRMLNALRRTLAAKSQST